MDEKLLALAAEAVRSTVRANMVLKMPESTSSIVCSERSNIELRIRLAK